MTTYNFYTIRELAPQQHECTPDMNFGYNAGRIKNRIYLPDTFIGATYYFDGEFSNRYGTSQLDDEGHPYIDINFNDGEIGNGTVFIIAGKRYCTFPYTLEYANVHETEIDASEIDTSNLVTKQTFDNTVERIDNDITTGDTANRTAIDQLTAATNQRFADVNTKLFGYDEQIGAVDTEIKNLASEVDGYSADIAKAVADAADAKSVAEGAADDAATADAAAKEAQDSVSALDTRVGAVENSVETAETTANEAKSAAQTAQTTAGEAQTAASGAKSRADEAYTLAETAKSDAEGATTKAATAQSTADGVKTRVDTLEETTIPRINNRVEALQTGEETLSKSIELLSGSVETVEENYNTLSDSVGLLTTEVEGVKETVSQMGPALSQAQVDSAAANEKADAINTAIHSTEKSVIGYESGSPSLVSPYTLGGTVKLTPDQIAAFGFGPDIPHKLGWSEFSIKPVITPPAAPGDRSYIRVTVIFNQDAAGGYQETALTATLSGTFLGDEILVWRYFHEIGLFVPYFKSATLQPGSLESAGIYPRVMSAHIGGNMYTRPNFSQNVASIHISSASSDNLSFNGGFSLNRYNTPPYFSE